MSTTVETTTSLEELMSDALEARAEVARLERLLAEARASARLVEKELNDHPDVNEDRIYFAGHVFEWRHEKPVLIWPCRYLPSPDEPTRDSRPSEISRHVPGPVGLYGSPDFA